MRKTSPTVKYFYWLFQGGTSFEDHSCYFCRVFVMLLWASVYCCLVVTRWEMAALLALDCDVLLWVCYFPIGILGQVWYLIVLIPDLCPLSYLNNNWKWWYKSKGSNSLLNIIEPGHEISNNVVCGTTRSLIRAFDIITCHFKLYVTVTANTCWRTELP